MSITPPVVALTQQDLLDLLERIFPASYLAGLRDLGPGYEVMQAYAAAFARLSTAVERAGRDGFIGIASTGAKATGEVELFRESASASAVTIKAGTVVSASRSGKEFVTTADVAFGALELGPKTASVEARAPGYEFNVEGQRTTADGTTLEGEIDAIAVLIEDPDLSDVTIQVRQIADTSGGADEALTALGVDRGLVQQQGETVTAYRARVRRLPETVSPSAIELVVGELLRPIKAEFEFIETWEITYQTCWDGPASTIPGSFYDPNLFAYDDPRDSGMFRNRWLSESDCNGAFIVVVERLQPISDTSLAYDDEAVTVSDLVSDKTGGMRAVCAYDVPDDFDFGAILGGYDGFDLGTAAVYKGLYDTLQAIKAAGVTVAVELQGE